MDSICRSSPLIAHIRCEEEVVARAGMMWKVVRERIGEWMDKRMGE